MTPDYDYIDKTSYTLQLFCFFVIRFRLCYWFDKKKVELRLLVFIILFKTAFGRAQISAPKIGKPMLKTGCINPWQYLMFSGNLTRRFYEATFNTFLFCLKNNIFVFFKYKHYVQHFWLCPNKFLATFQTDSAMVLFLSMKIAWITKILMCLFIPKTIMRKANILDEVQQRDVEKIKNIDFIQSTKLTTAAAEELTKVPNNFHDENLLKKSFRKMLQAIIKKGVLCFTNLSKILFV